MYKYTVLTFIFNNYEKLHEVVDPDPEAEYLLITDDPELKSATWRVVYDPELDGLSPFDKAFRVRYGLFKYAATDICVCIDGSVQIKKNFSHLIADFIAGNYDIAMMSHAERDRFADEYAVWMHFRNYPASQRDKFFRMLQNANYDLNFRGLYVSGFRIWRRTKLCADIDRMVMALLTMLGDENGIERLDQTVFSFVLNTFFRDINFMALSFQVVVSDYMQLCRHKSDEPNFDVRFNTAYPDVHYVFNRPTLCRYLLPPGVPQPQWQPEPVKKRFTYSFK